MILHIDSSPQHPSVSRELSAEVVEAILALEGSSEVIHHDLAAENVPHLTRQGLIPIRTSVACTPEELTSQALSDSYISELEAADTLVIGAPMYNFGITTQLKAWFDHVLRAGRTFRYTPEGPVGLLDGIRAIVVLSRGGMHSAGPARFHDHQEPHLRTMLSFCGIADVTFILAEGMGISPESRADGLAAARQAIACLGKR